MQEQASHQDKPIIVLIGLRGSGKSTLGARLADLLGRPFIDLDDKTAELLGHETPGAALRDVGIDAFRQSESEALRAQLEHAGTVLALGGGTPTAPGSAELLAEHRSRGRVLVMYLRAQPDELRDRLSRSDAPDRPALIGDNPIDEIQQLFEQRDPLYRSLADGVLHAGACDEHSTLAMLRAWAPAD